MNNCKFCGIKLDKNDRICPNCGGAILKTTDIDKLEKTIDIQEDKIEELEKDVKKYKEKHSKRTSLIIFLIILIILLITLPLMCCFFIFINSNPTSNYEQEYTYDTYDDINEDSDVDDNYYKYGNDNSSQINGYDNKINFGEEIRITINGKEKLISSTANDFINGLDLEIKDTYIINAKSSDYVRNDEMSVSLNVQNSSDIPLNYTECELIGIRFYTNYYSDSYTEIKSLNFYGLTLDTLPEETIELFGKPSIEYVSDYCIYKEWKTTNGWFEISWTLDEKLEKFAYQEFYTYY